ncbi:hypothetical protein Save01_00233 [Streptomyces avermitilis]
MSTCGSEHGYGMRCGSCSACMSCDRRCYCGCATCGCRACPSGCDCGKAENVSIMGDPLE